MSKRKILLILNALFIFCVICIFFMCKEVALALFLIYLVMCIGVVAFLLLNKAYLRSNHWKSYTSYEKQFISNVGYRDNLERNFEVVNLGSNPARYGFYYDSVKGQNWATGSQGLSMDFEVLKYYHSYIKENGYVLIPIMPFTSVSQYLSNKPEAWSDEYYMKFARILDKSQVMAMPNATKIVWKMRFPLLFDLKKIKYVFFDKKIEDGLNVAEQQMSREELEVDAIRWINMWLNEFDVESMDEFMSDRFDGYIKEGEKIIKEIIDFCLYRDLKPIIITVPMTSVLGGKLSVKHRKKLIYDFVSNSNSRNVPFLDYMFDERFQDDSLYNGAFFLNLKGRKTFSEQVFKDLSLM